MSTSPKKRKRLRYDGYDYSKSGAYFVTLCIENNLQLLGRAEQDTIVLTDAAHMVNTVWNALPNKFPNVQLDEFVIMPNHLHLVIWIVTSVSPSGFVQDGDSDHTVNTKAFCPSLPDIMQWFKSLTTAKYRHGVHNFGWPVFHGSLWQRSYYEHIVRSDSALYAIRRYIQENPQRWHLDKYHPSPIATDDQAVALWRLLNKEDRPT